MMMPANYSALAEAEMTYTVGGGIETLGSNIWTIVGNSYVMKVTNAVLGNMFSGAYKFGDATRGIWHVITGGKGVGSQGKYVSTWLGGVGQVVGMVAAVDQLMNNDVVAFAPEAGSDDYIAGDYADALITVDGSAISEAKGYSGAGSKDSLWTGAGTGWSISNKL